MRNKKDIHNSVNSSDERNISSGITLTSSFLMSGPMDDGYVDLALPSRLPSFFSSPLLFK
jgi:hypothetical protein